MKKNGLVKKLLGFGVVLTLALGLAGCGAKEGSALDQIKEAGVLKVATKPDYAPYEFIIMKDGQKKLVGFDISLAEEIAKDLGVKAEFEEMDFELIVEAVKTGRVNLGISGLTPKAERKQIVDFSANYYDVQQGMLVKSDSTIKTKEDLKGKKIGAQTGSIQYEMAMGIEGAEVTALGDVNNLVLDLKNGKFDVVLLELPVAKTVVAGNNDLKVGEEVLVYKDGGNAVAVQKGQEELLEAVNKTVNRLIEEGKMEQFIKDAEELAPLDITGEE